MSRMTKTQAKKAYMAILQKAKKLYFYTGNIPGQNQYGLSTRDVVAIEKICEKYLKKF